MRSSIVGIGPGRCCCGWAGSDAAASAQLAATAMDRTRTVIMAVSDGGGEPPRAPPLGAVTGSSREDPDVHAVAGIVQESRRLRQDDELVGREDRRIASFAVSRAYC